MTDILMYLISLIFLACCGIIELLARLFGWSYTEACVYINLYLQYGVMMLSTLSVLYVAARKLIERRTLRRVVVLIVSILYNIPFVALGVWLYKRYGTISPDAAFALCRDDLFALGTHLDLPSSLPYYREGWTEYYIVNLVIFIVLYLLVFLVDWVAKRCIKKYV